MIIDTHTHLDDEQFAGQVDAVIERAARAGVGRMIGVGVSWPSSRAMTELASRQAGIVFAAVGIHPNYCGEANEGDWERVVELVGHPRVVALGETGLDGYWKDVPMATQQDYFDRHLRLAQQRDLPVIIHMRDCGAEVLAMLREARRRGAVRGIMHSFSGDLALAQACLEIGLHISFSGIVTYKKSDALREVARQIPRDRLLVETDSPYLSPHPLRSQRPNEPALIVHTCQCLADALAVPFEQICEWTTRNADELFRLG